MNATINKVVLGNETLLDLTADTVTPATLMHGYTAHDASGALITGTATGGGYEDGDPLGYGLHTSPLVNVARADSAIVTDYAGSDVGRALVGLAFAG